MYIGLLCVHVCASAFCVYMYIGLLCVHVYRPSVRTYVHISLLCVHVCAYMWWNSLVCSHMWWNFSSPFFRFLSSGTAWFIRIACIWSFVPPMFRVFMKSWLRLMFSSRCCSYSERFAGGWSFASTASGCAIGSGNFTPSRLKPLLFQR